VELVLRSLHLTSLCHLKHMVNWIYTKKHNTLHIQKERRLSDAVGDDSNVLRQESKLCEDYRIGSRLTSPIHVSMESHQIIMNYLDINITHLSIPNEIG
jgi:hypothetical protein